MLRAASCLIRARWGHGRPAGLAPWMTTQLLQQQRGMAVSAAEGTDTFLGGSNATYVEAMLAAWKKDPASVHPSWQAFFQAVDRADTHPAEAFTPPPVPPNAVATRTAAGSMPPAYSDSLGVSHLIRAYQVRGHEIAELDPLGLHTFRSPTPPPELSPEFHGFDPSDMDRELVLKGHHTGGHRSGFLEQIANEPKVTLRAVIERLKQTYCGTIGAEYMHIPSREKCNWIRKHIEQPNYLKYTQKKKLHVFERLVFAELFEAFLAEKFNTTKRFGLDGGESLIPGLKALVDRGSELGVHTFLFGMAHRGRLNVLANVMRKPMPLIFKEFEGSHFDLDDFKRKDWSPSSDVKYHVGTTMDRTYPDGRTVHLSLTANPSHLEAVNPVVLGKTRAKQYYSGNTEADRRSIMPVLVHGDAALAGQGIVYETMQLAKLPEFGTGGTIHAVINNQVGFTTDPSQGRSTRYCTDIGKAFDLPVFHCNGDDALAVCSAFEMAAEWRHEYGEDCIVDIVCYRRLGHNEIDQPLFTQPKLYAQIQKHPHVMHYLEQLLLKDGTATQEDIDGIKQMVRDEFEDAYEARKTWQSRENDWLGTRWKGFHSETQKARVNDTGVPAELLQDVGDRLTRVPENFNLHPIVSRILRAKAKSIEARQGIDWGTAEALAFGTLLIEGNHVRLSGQDVERGTFSHRHAVLHDQKTNETYVPLNHLRKHALPQAPMTVLSDPDTQSDFIVRNSILSEYGVLGFETGYALENPNSLVLWEAQFGDFANGAQIMIDQFIACGEDKWKRQCGLVMLLPHGYDGQGAEHSSCRIERFLQLVNEDEDVFVREHDEREQINQSNLQVVNCTTPANYFHVLRRQVHRDFRKPLVVISPKNLLRHKRCVSNMEDMTEGTRFHRVLPETDEAIANKGADVRRVLFCSGKIYYELLAAREEQDIDDVAIVRVEQIAPFPFDSVEVILEQYPNAELVWCQEEPKNMGCWFFAAPRIRTVSRDLPSGERAVHYAGRQPASAPATGLGGAAHKIEQDDVIASAFAPFE